MIPPLLITEIHFQSQYVLHMFYMQLSRQHLHPGHMHIQQAEKWVSTTTTDHWSIFQSFYHMLYILYMHIPWMHLRTRAHAYIPGIIWREKRKKMWELISVTDRWSLYLILLWCTGHIIHAEVLVSFSSRASAFITSTSSQTFLSTWQYSMITNSCLWCTCMPMFDIRVSEHQPQLRTTAVLTTHIMKLGEQPCKHAITRQYRSCTGPMLAASAQYRPSTGT